MIAKTRRFSRPLSVVLMLALMLSALCFGTPPKVANAAYLDYINENSYYYIKNLRSGKYLTVQGGSLTSGANIVQWGYTGDNNQKWKLHYTGDTGSYSGNYVFYAYNTSYVIAMPNGSGNSGLQAKLASYSGTDNKQFFVITADLGNSAHRFFTKASNCILALVANNASIYNNTSIVQDNIGGQWNDQWLIEPVNSYEEDFGITYASDNYNHRLATYPDFDYCTANNHIAFESTNYVSQCLVAGGMNYYKPSDQTTANWWYINKVNHVQNVSFTEEQLGNYWYATQPWYNPDSFRNFWVNIKNATPCPTIIDAYNIVHMTVGESGWNPDVFCFEGDIILVRKNTAGVANIKYVLYTKERAHSSGTTINNEYWQPLKDCLICAHSGNTQLNMTTLWYFLKQLGAENSHDYSIEIIHMI